MASELRKLIGVWLALLALLGVTVAVSAFELGAWNAVLNVAIAGLKAALIAAVFMHLREGGGVMRLAAATGFVWLLILLVLTFADYLTRPTY